MACEGETSSRDELSEAISNRMVKQRKICTPGTKGSIGIQNETERPIRNNTNVSEENAVIQTGNIEFIKLVYGTTPAFMGDSVKRCYQYWLTKCIAEMSSMACGLRSSFGPTSFTGMARLKRVMRDFNYCVPKWESYQVDVFHMICNCVIKQILGADADFCLETAMNEFEWRKIPHEALILAYRGSGKSMILTAMCAVFLKNIPGCTICSYAGVKQKSTEFYNQMYSFYERISSLDEDHMMNTTTSKTEDMLTIRVSAEDIRWMRPFSTGGMVCILLFLSTSLFLSFSFSFFLQYIFLVRYSVCKITISSKI